MKRLYITALLCLPLFATAQINRFEAGAFTIDMHTYTMQRLAEKDTLLFHDFAAKLLPKDVKTIYLQKSDYLKGLPDKVEGYTVRQVDLTTDSKKVYEDLNSRKAVLLYLSDAQGVREQFTVWLMPMQLVKKGNEYEQVYAPDTYKLFFVLNLGNARFYLDKTAPYQLPVSE